MTAGLAARNLAVRIRPGGRTADICPLAVAGADGGLPSSIRPLGGVHARKTHAPDARPAKGHRRGRAGSPGAAPSWDPLPGAREGPVRAASRALPGARSLPAENPRNQAGPPTGPFPRRPRACTGHRAPILLQSLPDPRGRPTASRKTPLGARPVAGPTVNGPGPEVVQAKSERGKVGPAYPPPRRENSDSPCFRGVDRGCAARKFFCVLTSRERSVGHGGFARNQKTAKSRANARKTEVAFWSRIWSTTPWKGGIPPTPPFHGVSCGRPCVRKSQ
jgi:hypothetical protein